MYRSIRFSVCSPVSFKSSIFYFLMLIINKQFIITLAIILEELFVFLQFYAVAIVFQSYNGGQLT